jgi:hypothetical protein
MQIFILQENWILLDKIFFYVDSQIKTELPSILKYKFLKTQ